MPCYEVRIYDGKGNLKKIVQPEIDYEFKNLNKNKRKFNKIPPEKIDPVVHDQVNQSKEVE